MYSPNGTNDIFTLDRVQFDLTSRLVCGSVSNNILVVALENNHILRIDLQQASAIDEVELPRKGGELRIRRLFFDPTGRHLLIGTEQGENYYLFEEWQKPKLLSKLKGLVIESVAWNKLAARSSRHSTQAILLGTQDGRIFETEIEPTEEFFRREEKYLRLVYTIPEPAPIAGLYCEAFPATPRKYFVLASTLTHIYQFVGNVDIHFAGTIPRNADNVGAETSPEGRSSAGDDRSMYQRLFHYYDGQPVFQEIPGDLSQSSLCLFSKLQDVAYQSAAEKFAWLTGSGVYHGQLVYGSQEAGDSVVSDPVLLPYPMPRGQSDGEPVVPISLALTEFHAILLYPDSIRAVCLLNDETVFEDHIPLGPGERAIALSVDTVHNTFWVFTPSSVFELLINQEDRHVWRIFLGKRSYETAFQYAKHASERNHILGAQADHYYSQGRYVLAASYYARTDRPFETIALKLVDQPDQAALKCYLTSKLEHLPKSATMQVILLGTWLLEIYLNQLNRLDAQLKSHQQDNPRAAQCRDEKASVLEELHALLNTHKRHLDHSTNYTLIQNYGRHEELLYYATLLGDYEKVIAHWITEGQYELALDVLGKHGTPAQFYRYVATLMHWCPEATVQVLMRQPDLSPRKLIPAFLKYQEVRGQRDQPNQVIRYLQFIIQKQHNEDPVIHNYLLSVYATQPTQNETALLEFLANEGQQMYYDADFALRVCRRNQRIQSCVHLYSLLGQYEDAVNLALEHDDVALAQINADKPMNDPDLRRRLWLKIARYVVEDKRDVRQAMALLHQCPLLTIEQILPFFPAFTQIDDFKDEICTAIEEYDRNIQQLRGEMDEATLNAKAIQQDIRHLRNRFVLLSPGELCGLCEAPLLSRQLYAFPCQHTFHAECLVNKVTKHLLPRRRQRVLECQRELTKLLVTKRAGSTDTNGQQDDTNPTHHLVAQLKAELDGIVAAECVLCGDMMIRTIDKQFVDEDKEHELVTSWAV
ncbi:tethering complex subunit [Dispira parvispora]|uniref:Tethering complex subunit n=1 Tax=Dispira parvispora TaxID=1520584 RepID=A0A9W8AS74_9FUNG|nr:tethering complex subunit [Dispira parvispora]